MRPSIDLVLANIAEFNLGLFRADLDPLVEREFHDVTRAYADQSLMWSDRDRILVLPTGVDGEWLEDVCHALGEPVPTVISPADRTGALVADLLLDGSALARLRDALGGPREVRLLCWGASPELYPLIAAVAGWQHRVETEVPTAEDYWTTRYLDSKLSCLDLLGAVPEASMPRTWTVNGQAELRGVVDLVRAGGAAVVKSPWGVGGEGYHVVGADGTGLAELWAALGENPFLRRFPLIVQEFVPTVPQTDTPSVDLLLGPDGVGMTITSVIGTGGRQLLSLDRDAVLPAPMAEQAHRTASRIATWAAGLGYRGWLGVDYLAGLDGRLHLLELNPRRTGGVHAAALLARRPDRDTAVACVDDSVDLGPVGPLSYMDIRAILATVPIGQTQLYPSTVRGLSRSRPRLGLVALGPDATHAQRCMDEACAALGRR